ncbi:MAG TPA: hypothetical protein VGX46_12045 [Vicinamibacterales bacterium]|nr:hypothetical protein [Vicinamibacterales bacterium]
MTLPDIPHDLFRLDGRVAVVTGGLGRLGSQYVRTLVVDTRNALKQRQGPTIFRL